MLKVQLFSRAQDWIEHLDTLRAQVTARREVLLTELRELDVAWEKNKPLERIAEIWRLLGYYDRWIGQLQERAVQLAF